MRKLAPKALIVCTGGTTTIQPDTKKDIDDVWEIMTFCLMLTLGVIAAVVKYRQKLRVP
jgi:hypothetical protein